MNNVGFSQQESELWNLLADILAPTGFNTTNNGQSVQQPNATIRRPPGIDPSTVATGISPQTEALLGIAPSEFMYESQNHEGQEDGFHRSHTPVDAGRGLDALNMTKNMMAGIVSHCRSFIAVRSHANATTQSHQVQADVSILSSAFLDLCLQTFWDRFLPTLPLIHRATFDMRSSSAPLLINMVAIGALLLSCSEARLQVSISINETPCPNLMYAPPLPESGIVALGAKRSRLRSKPVSLLCDISLLTLFACQWDDLMSLRGPYDDHDGVQLLLTALLGQMYGSMSTVSV